MPIFEVTLQKGRTDTVRLEADSLIDIQTIYENLSDAKINTIKKVVYFNPAPKDTTTNYYRELKVLVSNGKINRFVNIRFVKPIIDKQRLINLFKTYLKINDLKVTEVQALTIHK